MPSQDEINQSGQEQRARGRAQENSRAGISGGIDFDLDLRSPEERRLDEEKRQRRIRRFSNQTLDDYFYGRQDDSFLSFVRGLDAAFQHKLVVPDLLVLSPHKESDLMYAMFQDMDIRSNILRNNANGSVIVIEGNSINFNQTARVGFSMDDAFEMALLAAHNEDMLGAEIKLTGTPKQRAMLQHALNEVNAVLQAHHEIEIKNPADILPEYGFERLTLGHYLEKMGATGKQEAAPSLVRTGPATQPRQEPPQTPHPQPDFAARATTPTNERPSAEEPDDIAAQEAAAEETSHAGQRGWNSVLAHMAKLGSLDTPNSVDAPFVWGDEATPPGADDLNALPHADIVMPHNEDGRYTLGDETSPAADAIGADVEEDLIPPVVAYTADSTPPAMPVLMTQEQRNAKGLFEITAIQNAIAEHTMTSEDHEPPGKAYGDITFETKQKGMFGLTRKGTASFETYTAQVDLYDNGTPPATVKYFYDREAESPVIVLSIDSEGSYEPFERPEASKVAIREDYEGALYGPEVLNATKYLYPHATFVDEQDYTDRPSPSADAQPDDVKKSPIDDILPEESMRPEHQYELDSFVNAIQGRMTRKAGPVGAKVGSITAVLYDDQNGKAKKFNVYGTKVRLYADTEPATVIFAHSKNGAAERLPIILLVEGKGHMNMENAFFIPMVKWDKAGAPKKVAEIDYVDGFIADKEQRWASESGIAEYSDSEIPAETGAAPAEDPARAPLWRRVVSGLVKGGTRSAVVIGALSAGTFLLDGSPSEAISTGPKATALLSRVDLTPEIAEKISLDIPTTGQSQQPLIFSPNSFYASLVPSARSALSVPPALSARPTTPTQVITAVWNSPRASSANILFGYSATNTRTLDSRLVATLPRLVDIYAECEKESVRPITPIITYTSNGRHETRMHPENRAYDLRADNPGHSNAPTTEQAECINRGLEGMERTYGVRVAWEDAGTDNAHWHVGVPRPARQPAPVIATESAQAETPPAPPPV